MPGGEGGTAERDPEPSTEQGPAERDSGKNRPEDRVYLLSVKFLPAWYLNPWAMLFELLHITNQRTSPLYRGQ